MRPSFIENSKWPMSKESEEKVANPSYHTQVYDHLIDELFKALESKDASALRECLRAIGDCIRDENNS